MVKFNLDKKEDQASPIFLALHYRGKKIKVYTGKKIDQSKWDYDTRRANPRKYKNNCVGFNAFLQQLSDEVEKLINDNKPISKADIKNIVDKANGKNAPDTFFGFAESYIQGQITNGELESISAKAYWVTLNHLKALNPALTFNDVDLNFYDKFIGHLRKQGLAPNTIGSNIKRLKWFMGAALDRDLHSNIAFKKKAFKTPGEETDAIYLTRAEINQLADKDLPDRLRKVADAFVINCFMGMRYSDLVQIQKNNFSKDNNMYHLHMIQGKTKEKITIPVDPQVVPLLKKYDFTCPIIPKGKLMSVQKFNEYLKEAAEKAEINAIDDVRHNGIVEKLPKFTLIKSHTARRSFSTNLYLEGVPLQNIMAITGHKKEETFLLYVRADQLTKSKGLAQHYSDRLTKKPLKATTSK